MKQLIYISFVFFLPGCGLKTVNLQNGYQKAAVNSKVYKNKFLFDRSLLSFIDTSCIYEASNDPNIHGNEVFCSAYRFYSNGCCNEFILRRYDSAFTDKTFDPAYAGWRGIYYKSNNQIKADMIVPVSGMGQIGIIKETLEFRGDTLIVSAKKGYRFTYIKRKISGELLNYEANW